MTVAEHPIDPIVGKTVRHAEWLDRGSDDSLELVFTDGTTLTLTSWDYEGYRSGISVDWGIDQPKAATP